MNEIQQNQTFDAFTNLDGTNYRIEGQINIPQLTNKLEQMGIKAIELTQLWRNVTGKVEYEGRPRFFKMASTEAIGQKIKNEVDWNNFANSEFVESVLKVPKIIKTGRVDGLFYYLAEFVEGQPLAAKNYGGTGFEILNFAPNIPQVSIFAAELQNYSYLNFSDQSSYQLSEDRSLSSEAQTKILMDKVNSFIQPVSVIGTSLEKQVNLVKENIDDWKYCINHADFTPWHVLESNSGQLYLIDGEHASLKPDFYDIAYFYHRTFTQAERPDLAEEFLQLTFSKLNSEKQALFTKQFPSVIASRIIGGYFDAVNDKVTDFSFHHQLKNLLEEGVIF